MTDRLGWTLYTPGAGPYGHGTNGGAPMSEGYVTDVFGSLSDWRRQMGLGPHRGIDIGAETGTGTPLLAIAPGQVQWVGSSDVVGNYISVATARGGAYQYFHLAQPASLAIGAPVRRGDFLGYMGATGRVTAPHLHLNYAPVNGQPWVDALPHFTTQGVWRGAVSPSGWSLVEWGGGSLDVFVEELEDNRIATAADLDGNDPLTFVVGAPEFVNQGFRDRYAGGVPAGKIFALTTA